jgi:hypothetical protein
VVIISTPGELVEQAVLLLWRRGGTKSAPDLVEQSRFLLRLVMPTERVPDLIKQTWFLVLRLGRFFVFLPVVCLEKIHDVDESDSRAYETMGLILSIVQDILAARINGIKKQARNLLGGDLA